MLDLLLARLRQHYPNAWVTTELLSIHDGDYVVRASVWITEQALFTGMAADSTLETAEDRACLRAIQRLISPQERDQIQPDRRRSKAVTNAPELATPPASPPTQPISASEQAAIGSAQPSLPPDMTPVPADRTRPQHQPPEANPPDRTSSEVEPTIIQPYNLDSLPNLTENVVLSDPMHGFDLDSPAFTTEPVDLSDIIAQTDVELKRLNWSVRQGREYLEKRYNKRSRHDLSDEELLEFLLYLETQPSAPMPPPADQP